MFKLGDRVVVRGKHGEDGRLAYIRGVPMSSGTILVQYDDNPGINEMVNIIALNHVKENGLERINKKLPDEEET